MTEQKTKHTFILTIDKATLIEMKQNERVAIYIESLVLGFGFMDKDEVRKDDGFYYKTEYTF